MHRHARTARNRARLQEHAAVGHARVEVDSVAEVRAVRDERDDQVASLNLCTTTTTDGSAAPTRTLTDGPVSVATR